MKKILILTSFILNFFMINAQNPTGEFPLSLNATGLKALPTKTFPTISNLYYDTLKYSFEDDSVNHETPFAIGQEMEESLLSTGVWDTILDNKIWRTQLISSTAYGVQLFLKNVNLPIGGKLFFYTIDSLGNKVGYDGAYTNYHNTPQGYLASAWYHTNNLIIEYNSKIFVPMPIFNLSHLLHGFNKQSGGVGNALKCHNDVNCNIENAWCNEIRSVCKITASKRLDVYKNRISGEIVIPNRLFAWSGSGAVLNNSNNDFRPLVLTARHVMRCPTRVYEADDQSPTDSFNFGVDASSVDFALTLFQFNYQHRECDAGFNLNSTICGSSIINTNFQINFQVIGCISLEDEGQVLNADLSLLEMNQKPPLQFNVFYAGWDRHQISDVDKNVTGIHHPSGDLKKISHGEIDRNYLGVFSKIAVNWTSGVTEKGSSGSPLYRNDVRRVIGALSLGFNDNCVDRAQRDRYGKLRAFWGKVKDELAPDDNDRNEYWGNDPIGACQNNLDLNTRFLPASIYRLAKPDILIQAANSINIANLERTEIQNLCIGSQTFNSNYKIQANNSISIKGNAGGFRIERGAVVSFKIAPCAWFGSCEQNYYNRTIKDDKGAIDGNFKDNLSTESSKVLLYPSPTSGLLNLDTKGIEGNNTITITNMLGQVLFSSNTAFEPSFIHTQINTSTYANGIYFMKITNKVGKVLNIQKFSVLQ